MFYTDEGTDISNNKEMLFKVLFYIKYITILNN